jgi:dienelactone hydrolase
MARGGRRRLSGAVGPKAPLRVLALTALGAALNMHTAHAQTGPPEQRGPLAVREVDLGRPSLAGAAIPLREYVPEEAARPRPVVVVMHGYLREGRFMAELGRTLASHGVVAVVPDMPCGLGGCDHAANARRLAAAFAFADTASADATGPLAGRVDGMRRALIGHSFGGLGAFLTATTAPLAGLSSAVLLDPNDDRGEAVAVATMPRAPIALIAAENPGACNGSRWRTSVHALTPAPKFALRVRGSGHCDPELPTDRLCPIACGRGDAATTPTFHRYAVAFTLCAVDATSPFAAYIGGAALDADVVLGRVDEVEALGLDALACRGGAVPPPLDAGSATDADDAAPDDAGASFADATSADATSTDATSADATSADATLATERASSCADLGGVRGDGVTSLALAAVAAPRGRRRRRQR